MQKTGKQKKRGAAPRESRPSPDTFLVVSSTNQLFALVIHLHHGLRPSLSTKPRAEYSPCDGPSARVPQLSVGLRVRIRLVFRRYIQDLRRHISELLPCCLLQLADF